MRPVSHSGFVDIFGDQAKAQRQRQRQRGRRKEQRTLHPLGPSCRQRLHHDQVPSWRSCECRSDRQLTFAKPTPSRRAAARRRRRFCPTFATPIPHISRPEPLMGGRRCTVDRALFRELNECVRVLDFLGTRIDACCTFSICPCRPEALKVGEGALWKLLAGKVLQQYGFLLRIVGHHGCTCAAQKNRMSLYPRQLSMRRV